jgi:hypothetical protein
MKRALAVLVMLGVLVLPVLVSADAESQGETRIPPESNWTSTPPTPPTVAVDQPRTVSTAREQTDVTPHTATMPEKTGYLGNWDPNIAAGD